MEKPEGSESENLDEAIKVYPSICDAKDKEGYHVVFTTHNSRTSARMIKYNVKKGPPIELNLDQEIALTQIIGDIITESGFHCIAYNICKDHVHMILVCEYKDLTKQVQKIKAISSKLIKRHASYGSSMEHVPLNSRGDTHRKGNKTYTQFWSQKFYRVDLDVWKLVPVSNLPGFLYKATHLENALRYIYHNREKHGLPQSDKLQSIIDGFLVDQEIAFAIESSA